MAAPVLPRKPVPKHAVKTAEVLHHTENHVHHEDEHFEEPSEKWLVSYADLMTLLFGFFVLMYSMSNIDQQKFAAAAESAAERFGGGKEQGFGGQYQDPTESIDRTLAKEMRSLPGLGDDVEVKKGHMGLEVSFRGKVLFESGQATLSPVGQQILEKLAAQIKKVQSEFTIRVEGHTDDVPIATAQFPSNWELSAARAIQVVKLFRDAGIEDKKLEAIGYADTRPIAPNRGPANESLTDNMAMNRRVMVRIQRVFQK
jgi:chemotaxis protein MotB